MSDSRIIEGLRMLVAQRAEDARRVMQRGVTGLPDYGKQHDILADKLQVYADGILAAVAEFRAAAAELLMHEVVAETQDRTARKQAKPARAPKKSKSGRTPTGGHDA